MTGDVGLIVCLTLLAFGVASAVGSAVSAVAFRFFRARLRRLPPASRARACLTWRLGPGVFALLFSGALFLPSFLLFEPRESGERVVLELLLLAALASLPVARSLGAAWQSWRSTRAVTRWWLEDAEELRAPCSLPCPAYAVEARFPVVAVVGVRRPFVVVSRSVLEACTTDELRAILAHETAHLENRDNLLRLLVRTAPDVLGWTRLATVLEREWEQASEEAADEKVGGARALDLASALVKVARLATGRGSAPRPAMAILCHGGDIARRIRRLAGDPPLEESSTTGAWRPLAWALAVVSVPFVAALPAVLRHLHGLTEVLVTGLQ